jgi:hypothetical protein
MRDTYTENFNGYFQVAAAGTVKRLKFLKAAGGNSLAKKIQIRVLRAAAPFTGKLHFKLFNKHLQTNYQIDEFVNVALGEDYIYLETAEEKHRGDFEVGDKLIVTGSGGGGTNDGTYTVSSVTVSSNRVKIRVAEAVTDEAAGSAAVAVNTVTTTHYWLDDAGLELTVDFTCAEIHFHNTDAASAMNVWYDAFSDEDISGTTTA